MHPSYTNNVIEVFKTHGDLTHRKSMSKYMRDKFDFFGINSPRRKEISKPLLARKALPEIKEIPSIARELWQQPQRELQYFALDLLQKFLKKCPADWIKLFEELITQKSWWDTVDGLAANQVGTHFKRFPELIDEYTKGWMDSGNIWLQRTCLIYQLKYKGDTDFELMKSFISPLVDSHEFFIKKAIGWALRQYGKFNPQAVHKYVGQQPMSALSKKEALKIFSKPYP